MKKITKKIIIATFLLVASFSLGYAFPREGTKTVQEPVRVENIIAIVNDDQRVDNMEGTSEFFSKIFIEKYFANQNIKTEVTSLSNAENGVTNKKYAGYVYFPSNFTSGLLSYNNVVPEQAVIKYKLNQNMDKEQMVVTDRFIDQQIAATTNDINYLYLTSFFKTINKSQADINSLQDLPKVVESQITSISNEFQADVAKLETNVNEDVKRTNELMKSNAEPIKPTKLLEYDIEQVRVVDPQKLVLDLSEDSSEVETLNFSDALKFDKSIETDLLPLKDNIMNNLFYGIEKLQFLENSINNASVDLDVTQDNTKTQLQNSFNENRSNLTLDKNALIIIKNQLEAMRTYQKNLEHELSKSVINQVKLEEYVSKLNKNIDNITVSVPDLDVINMPVPGNDYPVFDVNYQNFIDQITEDATISNLSHYTREYCNNTQASSNPLKLFACQLPPSKRLDLKIYNINAEVDNPAQEIKPEVCGSEDTDSYKSLYCKLVGNILPNLEEITTTPIKNLYSVFDSIEETVIGPKPPIINDTIQSTKTNLDTVLPPDKLETNLVAFGNEYNKFLENKYNEIQTLNGNYVNRNTKISELISTKQDEIFDLFEKTIENNIDQSVNKETITEANTKLDKDYDRLTAPFIGECTACVQLDSLSQLDTLINFNKNSISTIGAETNKLHGAYQNKLFNFKKMFEPAKAGEETNLSYVSYISKPLATQKITNESPVMSQTKVINPFVNVTNILIIGGLLTILIIVVILEKIIMSRVKRRR